MTVKFTRTISMKTPSDTISAKNEVVASTDSPETLMVQDGNVGLSSTKSFLLVFNGSVLKAAFISTDRSLNIGINGPYGDTNDGEFAIDSTYPLAYIDGDPSEDNPFLGISVESIHVSNPNGDVATLRMRLMVNTWDD